LDAGNAGLLLPEIKLAMPAPVSPDNPASPGPQTPVILETDHLHVLYQGGIRVLHGVSLSVREGACVALLGANGAGKTTTLKAISGMLAADGGAITSGRVVLRGETVTSQPAHKLVKRGLIHVLEGRFVFPDLSVRDNLRMGAYTRRDSQGVTRDLDRVLDYFPRLRERIKIQAGYLSGGEQQMLAMARALMARPRVLLLDEPSMGLSPLLVREVFDILSRIRQQESLTILLVEQNARMALRFADGAYLIETGRILLEGAASEIRDDPRLKEVYLGGLGH
jgi:branched-chain amino acid transport system ATP-binding protein